MKIEKINQFVKENLSTYRYEHSILVAKEAKSLAKHYHIEEDKAYLAGLLHDVAKELTEEENEKWIEIGHLSKNLNKKENKNIKHADIGAIIAKEKFKLDDDICNAIKYHTIGNKNMDTLAKIIYIADKIGRKNIPDDLIPVKKLAYENLNKALLFCIEKQQINLKEKGLNLHQDTKELLKELKK